MSIKARLTILSFFQFFVWGAWLITIGTFWFNTKNWSGAQFGAVFSTLGIASIIMPAITGVIADKWINAERLYGLLHILYGLTLFYLYTIQDPDTFYWIMLVAMLFYMPTIALSNSISYIILTNNKYDVVKVFPPIRVWGTIGFIVAMWCTDLLGLKFFSTQFLFAGAFAVGLGLYAFTLPKCPPLNTKGDHAKWYELLGLDAFKLFANRKMATFFIFALFLGAALQLTNMYGDTFLNDFKSDPKYTESIFVKYSTIVMSISQISETVFILAIPFFLYKFGIKKVMLISMTAWFLRFGLFSIGYPEGVGLLAILLSNIIYGMAFDFFNISGSIFVETSTEAKIRSSAQGLFMMMSNGFGAVLGSYASGYIIDRYFLDASGGKMWSEIWITFAIYAAIIAVLFALLFRYKHQPGAASTPIKH